ncbi:MAG: thioredoxin domain-containing protein [Phycisphaerales bacterium]|nr:thioredoxin domain-containing protein [Phycisphaerales bacterium]
MSSERPTNRLARESSPYLLQHAHNPVDWWPWGTEAFAEARRRNVPIFLSIGYSTCYWCHVMERESFENSAIAALLNERFVCIKLDREEHPDIDEVYMAAVQMTTGRGGWPMSVFLEPNELRPFWAGTYFPPVPARGLPSFPQIVASVSAAWRDRRAEVLGQAGEIADAVREHLGQRGSPAPIGVPQVAGAVSALLTTYDHLRGGFGDAPKFPQPVYLDLLLAFLPFAGDDQSRAAVEAALRHTLDRMAIGGMFDQVGGGFHRYSVDAEWTVPHFEKMLYDNALLAGVYARASECFADAHFVRVTRRTLDYVLREMTLPSGGFFSAQDAEVAGREGLNYLWTEAEFRAALPGDDADFAVRVYGLDAGPNFHDPHHPDAPPASVPRLADRPDRIAAAMGVAPAGFHARLDRVNTTLYGVRSGRTQPRIDTKVLVGWNGLMISALGVAGKLLAEPRYLDAAERAAAAVLDSPRTPDGGLPRSMGSTLPAVLEDYAAFVAALADLHRAGRDGGGRYLDAARTLALEAAARFGDGSGGYLDSQAGASDLFVRPRSTYDGAIPCGTSIMANALVTLREVTGEHRWLDAAAAAIASISGAIAASPVSTSNSTRALLRILVSDPALMPRLIPGAAADPPARPAEFTPVQVFASQDRLSIREGTPATLSLRLVIAPGYHINAADPQPGRESPLIGLRADCSRGAGLAVYADYPDGQPYGADGSMRVHRGETEFDVVVERSGPWSGHPVLTVTFQACTDTECLEPATVELDVALDPA